MTKIKSLLIAASLMMGFALPATAQIGEPTRTFLSDLMEVST